MKHYETYLKAQPAPDGATVITLEATAFDEREGALGTWVAASAATTAQTDAADAWGNPFKITAAADAAMAALKELAAPWAERWELATDIVPPLEGSPFTVELERWASAQESDLQPGAGFYLEKCESETIALCQDCYDVAGADGPDYQFEQFSTPHGAYGVWASTLTCSGCGRSLRLG